jgi:hypothetical protein
VPLIIAIHGGTYTSRYFDVPGHSLLDQAGRNGIPAMSWQSGSIGISSILLKWCWKLGRSRPSSTMA